MSVEGEAVVIDDDEDMEIIEINDDDDEDRPPDQAKKTKTINKPRDKTRGAPNVINGYAKPAFSYCQMITQALAASPERRATFFEICDMISTNQPYYKYYTGNWRRAIRSALTKRKKFFVAINLNSSGDCIWALNPAFEKLMMEKWVPKKKPLESRAKESLTPVIVSATSLSTGSGSNSVFIPCDESYPEFVLADPDKVMSTNDDSAQNTRDKNPWEPEITVSEAEDPETDFSLSNLRSTVPIQSEEEYYRTTFMKEHPDVIEKFRLHCTVCDCHLGTSGSEAKDRVRLHATLGVLTCVRCYSLTWNVPANLKSKVCTWCFKGNGNFGGFFSCSSCPSKFCEVCVKRNFGTMWCNHITKGTNWLCFLCNTKQIWPHRAIAYSLLHHYCNLKRRRAHHLKLNFANNGAGGLQFYTKDLSTCCKGSVERSGDLTLAAKSQEAVVCSTTEATSMLHNPSTSKENITIPSIQPTKTDRQMFIVDKQPPGHIYFQSTQGVPSFTLNTGTQYIHNVYPNKNYVVVQPPNVNRISSSSTIARPQSTNIQMALPQRLVRLSSDPNFTVHHRPNPITVECESAVEGIPINTRHITQTVNPLLNPIQNVHILPGGMLVTNRIEESDGMIVPDEPQELIIPDQKERSLLEMSIKEKLKEKIERRPMPKSKKQSLLRAVLMSESIESMKKQLQTDSTLGPSATRLAQAHTNHTQDTSNPVSTSKVDKSVEEPILKSIIQTATERLLNLQNKPSVSQSNSGNETINSNDDTNVSTLQSETENKVPKIKIKTLKELQELGESDKIKDNIQTPIRNSEAYEPSGVEVLDRVEHNMEADEPLKEVDVTSLKQGIIESSRTLVSTQKRFKELAKVISSNLSYQTEQAAGLVMKFQDILKSCRNQIESIDKNVQNQYGHLIPNNNIDMILESIKNTERIESLKQSVRSKWCKKLANRITSHQSIEDEESSVGSAISDVSSSSRMNSDTQLKTNIPDEKENVHLTEGSGKRKRDLVHFNPLGKKVILGSPEVTEEDLQQFPNAWNSLSGEASSAGQGLPSGSNPVMRELLKRQSILASSSKKRCIWDTKRRKCLYFKKKGSKYNKDGSIRKRLGRPPKSSNKKESYPSPRPKHKVDPRLDIGVAPPLRPLRSSERKRTEECIVSYLPGNYEIKPCSVVIHTLDPKIVQLWEKRIRDERLIPE